jgi:hypothetical protein
MTAEKTRASDLAAGMPELCIDHVPRKSEGAGKAGWLAAPMARQQQKSWRQSPQVSQSTGPPCAMVLRLIRDLPGDRAFLPPSLRRRHQRNLASASGGQDHTTSPSVSTSLVLRHRYVHRIPRSTFVTTRPSLQMSTGWRETIIFFRKTEARTLDARIRFTAPCEHWIFRARDFGGRDRRGARRGSEKSLSRGPAQASHCAREDDAAELILVVASSARGLIPPAAFG